MVLDVLRSIEICATDLSNNPLKRTQEILEDYALIFDKNDEPQYLLTFIFIS